MKKDLAKQIYKDSGWQIDKDTKTTDYKPASYCIFGEANAGKVPVGREDGLIEFKDYSGGSGGITNFTQSVINNDINKELTITNVVDGVAQEPYTINYGGSGTELPIIYEETYELSKIISGYLTAFANVPNGLYFRLANNTPKCLATIDYRFDGEITNVGANGNTLTFTRNNQPSVVYTPTVTADITSYTYSDTSTHTISGRAEANWWLIIPKTSFGSTTNVLNVRTTKATATSTGGNVDLSSSTMVSVWKVVDATSLPEAIVIDPNATIGDLMVLLDVRNTSNAQVSVNNVEFTIQTNIINVETGNVKLIGYAVVRLNSTSGSVEVVSSTGSIQVVGYGTDEPTIFLIQGFGTIEAQYRLISVECFNTEYKVRLATAFDSTHQQFAVTPDTNEYYNIMIWSHKQ